MNTLNKVNFIAVHCADTPATMDLTKEMLYQWHVVENSWSDIGYHYLCKFDGSVIPCRDVKYTGAHCKAINDKSLAICLEGGYQGQYNFTQSQLQALRHLIKALKVKYPNAAIVGHNHFDDKACPVINIVEWWESE